MAIGKLLGAEVASRGRTEALGADKAENYSGSVKPSGITTYV